MAALNQRETEEIRDAMKAIQMVLRNGYTVGDDRSIQNLGTKDRLEKANKRLLTIVQMKGYYPNG
jgi:hypothetical protein